MSMKQFGMKVLVGKTRKLREKHTQTTFRPPRNPHSVTETRTRDPIAGRRASNRLSHGAAEGYIHYHHHNVFYPKAGPSLQAEKPR